MTIKYFWGSPGREYLWQTMRHRKLLRTGADRWCRPPWCMATQSVPPVSVRVYQLVAAERAAFRCVLMRLGASYWGPPDCGNIALGRVLSLFFVPIDRLRSSSRYESHLLHDRGHRRCLFASSRVPSHHGSAGFLVANSQCYFTYHQRLQHRWWRVLHCVYH